MPLLLALLLAQADPATAAKVGVGGRVDLRYVYREGNLNQAGGVLNGLAAPETGSTNAWTGRFAVRVVADVDDWATGVVEFENRSFDEGVNRPLSSDPEEDEVDVKSGYLELRRFGADSIDLRLGVQRIAFRNRPHDEPFFIDLGESEGFFEGFSGGRIGVTADRDVREASGAKGTWSPNDFMSVQAFWAVYGEFGTTEEDESVYGIAANSMLSERAATWLLFTVVSGGDPDLGQVGTLGAGFDGYFGADRDLELFAEVYGQRGTLQEEPRIVRKVAYAVQAGLRWNLPKFWWEAAYERRSGDRRGGDRVDQAFQSWENVNRFLILESAEFGLDVDTNVQLARSGIGLGPFELQGRPLRIRLDAGRCTAPAAVSQATSRRGDWGVETDLQITWAWATGLQLWMQGAWLADSDLVADLTGGRDQVRALLLGADLRF
jgi:hypothetical protein